MKKILLALLILSAGAAAFHTVRQSTQDLEWEGERLRQLWSAETQHVASAQTEQAGVTARVGDLKHSLAQSRPAVESPLWASLQTNHASQLPRELREQLREELGFTTWAASKDYILVSKEAFENLRVPFLHLDGKLNDVAAATLSITSDERSQLEAAMEKVKTDFKDWVVSRVERSEPAEDLVARYVVPGDTNMAPRLRKEFFAAVTNAIGRERIGNIRDSAEDWLKEMGLSTHSTRLTIKRVTVGEESRLRAEVRENGRDKTIYLPTRGSDFPKALRQLFPNGWAGLAEREGFELPEKPPKK